MTINRTSHPEGDVDRLYTPRIVGGRGLSSVEESVKLEKCNFVRLLEELCTQQIWAHEYFLEG